MELSPLALEKLAKLGELSDSEKEKLRFSDRLTSILSDYFTDRIDTERLQDELEKSQEESKEFMTREIQTRLLYAITPGSNTIDFERCRNGVLCCETLKSTSRYKELELNFNTIKDLRTQYSQEKDAALQSMKEQVQGQVRKAAQQAARQARNKGLAIDMEGSIEASVKSSTQWRNFILSHEKKYGEQFDKYLKTIEAIL
jgi:hypothetical protein